MRVACNCSGGVSPWGVIVSGGLRHNLTPQVVALIQQAKVLSYRTGESEDPQRPSTSTSLNASCRESGTELGVFLHDNAFINICLGFIWLNAT